MGVYDGWRSDGGPTLYGPIKTAVTADVLEAGFLYAAAIIAFSLLVALPGERGIQRVFAFVRIIIGVFVLASILLVNFGQEWEVAEVSTRTPYRAGLRQEIHAHIKVKIGLRSINVTLKGDPEEQVFEDRRVNETINYNERFSWNNEGFTLGRAGFGPLAGRFNQEFRAAQRKGLPYPILWVAEYFTIDGEGIRWGRHYLQAGYYTHIMIWTAFPLWILAMMLCYMVVRYGGYFSLFTGGSLLIGNILWATIRNANELKIPFEDEWLIFKKGWSFWLCLFNGLLCIIIGIIIVILDLVKPEALATFFGLDIATFYEDYYVDPAELKVLSDSGQRKKRSGTIAGILSKRSNANSGASYEMTSRPDSNGSTSGACAAAESGDSQEDTVYNQTRMYRKRTILGPKLRSKPPAPPKQQKSIEEQEEYINVDTMNHAHVNPAFDKEP